MKYTFWFECTDNGGGHQAFEVKAENKQEAIKKGMAFAKKYVVCKEESLISSGGNEYVPEKSI